MSATAAVSFRPRPWTTLLLAASLPCLVGLGCWQLDRAEAKEAAQRALEAQAAAPALALPATRVEAAALRGRHVAARGRYEPARQFFWDNRVWRGQAGYEVVTPLRLDGGELAVLVDRGWIPLPADRRQLPAIATPEGQVDVEGIALVPPADAFSLAPASATWEPVWQHVDPARFERIAGVPVQPVVVRLAPESAAGGFVRDWPRADAGVERHRGYALQWFGFAATAVGLWLWHSLAREAS